MLSLKTFWFWIIRVFTTNAQFEAKIEKFIHDSNKRKNVTNLSKDINIIVVKQVTVDMLVVITVAGRLRNK